ncbi:MAG: hypothetical protein NC250_06265 [Alistipes senegalensis]|nr:hypothetical protein [Bacteroides cellulosilyticus]MCM1352318.1 hypothetical protein [Alistipes senegalensis]
MDWQTLIVWAIGAAIASIIARGLYRFATGRSRSGCAACDETECPLRKPGKQAPACPKPNPRRENQK